MRLWLRTLLFVFLLICLPVVYLVSADFDTEDVVVAVLDTGVDGEHPLLKGRVMNGYDFASMDSDSTDPNGHGTHVAGIVASEAPSAQILSVRVIAENDNVINTPLAIVYSILRGADVVNMSFIEPKNTLTKWAIAYGQSKGVVFVASSGNQGRDRVSYPSKYEGVYSIAGFDEKRQRVVGNVGEEVRYVAPGVNVRSADLNGGYTEKSGTSMSAGYMSGVIAYIQSVRPGVKPEQLDFYLQLGTTEVVIRRVQSVHEGKVFQMIELNQVKTGLSRLNEQSETHEVAELSG